MRRRKKKRNYMGIIVTGFLVLLMVTSIIGFLHGGSGDSQQSARYEKLRFSLTQQGWQTTIDGDRYFFANIPQDVEYIQVPDSINFASIRQMDITSDENATAKEQIAQSAFLLSNVATNKNIYVRQGFTNNNSFNAPIITCDEATEFVPVVWYKSGPRSQIIHEGYCILIEAPDHFSYLQLTDRFAYALLGVIE